MSMYYAPAFFSYLLGKCLKQKNWALEVGKLGIVVIGTFMIIWWPYLYSMEAAKEVLPVVKLGFSVVFFVVLNPQIVSSYF